MMKNLFTLTEEQKRNITESIKQYVMRIENQATKNRLLLKMQDDDFKKQMIFGFAMINFLSQTCIHSLKKLFNDNVVYASILKESENDIFEVKELKVYMLNCLIDENLPKDIIDKELTEIQLKEYRRKMGSFKGEYVKMFEDKSTIN